MKYDAACIGDDDLQYGGKWLVAQARIAGVPLVSANCFAPDGRLLAAPYVIVRRGDIFRHHRRNDAGTDRAHGRFCYCKAADAGDAWHLGRTEGKIRVPDHSRTSRRRRQPSTPRFVSRVRTRRQRPPEELHRRIHHRSRSGDAAVRVPGQGAFFCGNAPDSKGWASRETDGLTSGPQFRTNRWWQGLITLPKRGARAKRKRVFDLYIMSQCPYGCAALREFVSFAALFPRWNGTCGSSARCPSTAAMTSLHGADEMNDEMLWLSVRPCIRTDGWNSSQSVPFLRD